MVDPLVALARKYVTGRYRRGEIGEPTRDAIAYTLSTLTAVHGARPVARLGPKAIDQWLETIADRAPSTRRNMVSRVRHFCRWLMTEGHIKRDPTGHVPAIRQPRRVPVTLTDTQAGEVRTAELDTRAQVVLALMLDVGCRCVEVSRICVEDVDMVGRLIRLTGKGGHERQIPLPQSTAALISKYLDEVGVISGPLIRSHTDSTAGLKPATLSHYVRRWLTDLGVKQRAHDGRSAHGLRRTAGSEVMEESHDIRVVQAVLGHERIETTARYYLRPVPLEAMRAAMESRGAAPPGPPPMRLVS